MRMETGYDAGALFPLYFMITPRDPKCESRSLEAYLQTYILYYIINVEEFTTVAVVCDQ